MRSVWKIIFCSLLTSLLPLLPASVIAQETSCQYQVTNEWGSGYTATITISNQSAASVSSWSVNWEYQANRINNLWNAMLSGDNPYTAKSLSWNGTLAPGASVEFGFQVDKNGGAAGRMDAVVSPKPPVIPHHVHYQIVVRHQAMPAPALASVQVLQTTVLAPLPGLNVYP